MTGRNLFGSYRSADIRAIREPQQGVFISHNSKDKPMARAVAKYLMDYGIDIYFDENDENLKAAVSEGDEKAIVKCIDTGLDICSHLLGIITPITFESWWVPYEIGGAIGRKRKCAHVINKDVTKLPSYVKVAPVLINSTDLDKWLDEMFLWSESSASKAARLLRLINEMDTKADVKAFVPESRSPIEYF